MFKCTECEKIYDIKPDYCDDCGNDTFEEIVEKAPEPEKVIVQKEEIKEEPKIIVEEIKPEPKKTVEKQKKDIDYPSLSFLLVCILISLYIIFFAWNPKEEDEIVQKPQNNEVKQNTNIPSSVNGFWNNEPPKPQPKTVVNVPPKEVQQVQEQPKIIEPKPVQNQQVKVQPVVVKAPEAKKPVKTVQTTQQKSAQIPPKQVQQNKPQTAKPTQTQQQKPVQTTQTKPASTASKPAQTTSKPVQTQTKPAQQTTQQPVWQSVQQPQTQTTQPKPVQTVDTSALKKELANYKINLRNTIGRKIDFANVIGDGSCTVSFKVASSGQIINRAFSQQSSNTTLNDAVYSAVMSTPSYNPPPSGYNGETMYLKISFYNGNFQISLN